ncbi:hypothetical protein TNCT_343721 [Trichonephila clavata]|uniref:Uncharacterized protein n=1 Tax=Trichonephila clavata TaxID=2740835 RepID=A0A8X6K1Y4_TRICU|nr:hypothetical protein TNCT_343721 [Trichonephila clavata]
MADVHIYLERKRGSPKDKLCQDRRQYSLRNRAGDTERQGLPGNTSLYRLKGLAETRIRICINKLKEHRTRPYKVRRGKNSLTPGFTMEEE